MNARGSTDYLSDKRLADAKLLSVGTLSYSARSPEHPALLHLEDFNNLGFCDFPQRPSPMSVLGHHVAHVVGVSSKPKMTWITARSIVTRMANAHSFWNWSIFQHVRKPRGGYKFILPFCVSVAIPVNPLFPKPALVFGKADKIIPESLFGSAITNSPRFFSIFSKPFAPLWALLRRVFHKEPTVAPCAITGKDFVWL